MQMNAPEALKKLTKWNNEKYNENCEHEFTIEIKNIDNPGWSININGEAGKNPFTIQIERSEEDWLHIKATEEKFSAYGGVFNLEELIVHAVKWIEKQKPISNIFKD
ncbi:hypothetical protein FRC75_01575 [Paracidovorax citrulli]|nr:hypothetical protein CQB05_07085 [Paracidovorax citrulli]UMT82203.1 hypothetical protein FRC75_01575 [Paracidovorax citrulli]